MKISLTILVAMLLVAAAAGAAIGDSVITPGGGVVILVPTKGTTLASCPPLIAGQTQDCIAASGAYFSLNGAAYVQYAPVAAIPAATPAVINGKSCGNCTISVAAGAVSIQ